jgi:hypothetical protein
VGEVKACTKQRAKLVIEGKLCEQVELVDNGVAGRIEQQWTGS